MRKILKTLLWLILALGLSALALHFIDRSAETVLPPPKEGEQLSQRAKIMLVGYEGESFPGMAESGSYMRVGCRDALIPTGIPVSSTRLESVLFALSQYEPDPFLHNPMHEKGLIIFDVREEDDGRTYRVSLKGNPELGRLCDLPRLKSQIEETIKLHTKRRVVIELNGSERDYRCMGRSKYECE